MAWPRSAGWTRKAASLVPVSDATLRWAIRSYQVRPQDTAHPGAAPRGQSLHPNHVWQIDASVCVLFYLDNGCSGVIEHDEFYKNKPENIEKKFKSMVIRYVVTDHYSGAVYFRYYLGAESGEMLCSFFIEAIQNRAHEKDPFHGVPFLVVVDPAAPTRASASRPCAGNSGCASSSIAPRTRAPRAASRSTTT